MVGIAGEDDLDAPDICVPAPVADLGANHATQSGPPRTDGYGRARGTVKSASTMVLSFDESAALRDRLLSDATFTDDPVGSSASIPEPEPTIAELDERIAMIRQNINELIEQAAAYSGAEDDNRTADRIAQQEQELSRLIELRDALLGR
jgi:hypothetical protein